MRSFLTFVPRNDNLSQWFDPSCGATASSDLVYMERLLIDYLKWNRPLSVIGGTSLLTNKIDVVIDFDWMEEIGHRQRTFTNYMSLGSYVRKNTKEGRKSILVLTNQQGKNEGWITEHDTHDIFIVNIGRFRQAARNDPSSAYFAGLQGTPVINRSEMDKDRRAEFLNAIGSSSIIDWINENPTEFSEAIKKIETIPLDAVDLSSLTAELQLRLSGLTNEEQDDLEGLLTSSEFPGNLIDAAQFARRRAAIAEFKEELEKDEWDEKAWERFFKLHQWIFGHGLLYQFVALIEDQVLTGGKGMDNTGGQVGDFAVRTMADCASFIALVDIKVPSADLIGDKYRNHTYKISDELNGGVSQVLNLCDRWVSDGSSQVENVEKALLEGWLTASPRGILIIGHSKDLDCKDKKRSFEIFRRSIHNLEILTFDELLKRAEAIVDPSLC